MRLFRGESGGEQELGLAFKEASSAASTAASAEVVNRTHRVIRERAKTMQEQKRRARSLWIPLCVSFGLLALLLTAVWSFLDEAEFLADGLPDAAQQMLVLSLWCLPLSVVVLALVLFRRSGSSASNGSL